MGFYDKYILPKFLNCACGTKPINYQREKIVPLAKGIVLDIGIGSGLNIPFYNKSNIDRLYGLDPSEELLKIAKPLAKKNELEIEFLQCGAEAIPLPDQSIDTVLITYTMCTIPDIKLSNSEIMRVLKSEGSPSGGKARRAKRSLSLQNACGPHPPFQQAARGQIKNLY